VATLLDAAGSYVEDFDNIPLNSAIGYITLQHTLAGHKQEIQSRPGSQIGGGEGTDAASGPRDG